MEGGAGAESLSHLVSEVSRPFPSLLPVDPSQPLLSPINEFSALPAPPLPPPQPPSLAVAPSPGWAPAPGKAPALSPGETDQEGVRGGGTMGAERGQGPRGRVGLTWLLRLQAPSNS